MRITKRDVLEMISKRIEVGVDEAPKKHEGEFCQGYLLAANQIKKLVCVSLEEAKHEEAQKLQRLSLAGAILGTASLILSVVQELL